jgi:hypothetical protein
MGKRRRSSAVATLLEPRSDYGHAFVHRGGKPVINARLAASDGVTLGDIPDPDRPSQRGAMVRVAMRGDPLLSILDLRDRNSPDGERYLAAERFRQTCQLANGSPLYGVRDILDKVLAHGCSSDKEGSIILRLTAQQRAREAWLAIRGPQNDSDVADVVRMVVLGWATMQSVETHRHWRHGRARPLLDLGLARLAEHYDTAR